MGRLRAENGTGCRKNEKQQEQSKSHCAWRKQSGAPNTATIRGHKIRW
jgi:hypothetical protein